ncbi:protein ALTERED PHOSPHATE STARVATION RESPONSE 1-like [Magnolia sinica]|uniref:protein ALTERED PHOSPHATE STARVATION RESPONSE 1-like n=1 Tax=Magnolia sinica TaxID=86752 RepID=UPI00265A9F76|nr:protein ALTERED PHOSPHATE STARVATION RESPONSE 1-like [Magnolia sinica]
MGGCSASKLLDQDYDDNDVVSLCRERKRLMKLAIDRRYTLADSHCKYIHSLYTVAAAIHLFVGRHTSPSPFLITLPPPISSSTSLPPSFSKHSLPPPQSSDSTQDPPVSISHTSSFSTSLSEEGEEADVEGMEREREEEEQVEEEEEEEEEEKGCGYVCRGMGMGMDRASPPMPSPARDFGWDFFNPFEGVRGESATESMMMMGGLNRSSDEDLRVVREEEGIPELEEEEDSERKVVVGVEEDNSGVEVVKLVTGNGGGGNVSGRMEQQQQKGLTVIETPARERELMEALKDVEDHFIRAYNSGKDVSRMLEANRVHLQSGLEEIRENSSKLIHTITWHRSTSSQSSSYKSYLASSSKDSTWTEYKNDLFEDYGGMESGSHSLTLGRLYAWEKKLYDEVKVGDSTRRTYERKFTQLRNQEARGDDPCTGDKTRAAVKDLYTRIWVSIRTAESISKRIQKLTDEELQPQLIELLRGLMKTWKVMLESHETQNHIMFEVKSFTSTVYGRFCGDSHRHATLQLEAELHNWRERFTGYMAAQKAYVEALDGWLSKFIVPEVEFYSRGRSTVLPYQVGAPPLLIICHDWLNSHGKLPDTSVVYAMKSFSKDVRALWVQQGEERQQKRKVDSLAKELDRRAVAFQRVENKILESKLSELKAEPDVRQRMEYLAGRKDLLDMFRTRLDLEKVKHHNCMQETQRITLNGFQTGLTSVFSSLAEFSKASLNMYNELVMFNEKANLSDEKDGKPSCIESCQVEVDSR